MLKPLIAGHPRGSRTYSDVMCDLQKYQESSFIIIFMLYCKILYNHIFYRLFTVHTLPLFLRLDINGQKANKIAKFKLA